MEALIFGLYVGWVYYLLSGGGSAEEVRMTDRRGPNPWRRK